MSFIPHPIIPQTVEQGRQRDQLHAHAPTRPENPVLELARLRNAIRAHRDTLTAPIDHATHPAALTDRAAAADHALWAHLPPETR